VWRSPSERVDAFRWLFVDAGNFHRKLRDTFAKSRPGRLLEQLSRTFFELRHLDLQVQMGFS
jgi:hypothetical protein